MQTNSIIEMQGAMPVGSGVLLGVGFVMCLREIGMNQKVSDDGSNNAKYTKQNRNVIRLPNSLPRCFGIINVNELLALFCGNHVDKAIRYDWIKRDDVKWRLLGGSRLTIYITVSLHVKKPVPLLALVNRRECHWPWRSNDLSQKTNLPFNRSVHA